MSVKCSEITKHMERLAPLSYAYDWDNCGLLIGGKEKEIQKVLIALEVVPEIIDFAIENKVDLIITHHPLIFKPLKKISLDNLNGNMIYRLIQNNIYLYSAHTNLDLCFGGVNDELCNSLDLQNIIPLERRIDTEQSNWGLGRIGELENELEFDDFVNFIKERLNAKHIRCIGDTSRKVKKVAVSSGAYSQNVYDAIRAGCDVLVTGDVKHHDAVDINYSDITVIDAGHYNTEQVVLEKLENYMKILDVDILVKRQEQEIIKIY